LLLIEVHDENEMKIIKANIVELWKQGKIVCITTNGYIKKSKEGVLGRGNALAMAKLILDLPKNLGQHLEKYGNIVGFIYERIIVFPVKPSYGNYEQTLDHIKPRFKPTDENVPGFWCKADLGLIQRSMIQLSYLIKDNNLKEVYLPIPGVSNGGLDKDVVLKILEKITPEEVIFCYL